MTITVVRPGVRDRHGDPEPATDHPLDPDDWDIAPRSGTAGEDTSSGETIIVGLTLYGPFDANIEATDQVRIDGSAWDGLFDVVGEPGRWEHPTTGDRPGCEVALVRHG